MNLIETIDRKIAELSSVENLFSDLTKKYAVHGPLEYEDVLKALRTAVTALDQLMVESSKPEVSKYALNRCWHIGAKGLTEIQKLIGGGT